MWPGEPLALADPKAAWRVVAGTVDVYAELHLEDGGAIRDYVQTVTEGGLLLGGGLAFDGGMLALEATGREGADLERIAIADVAESGAADATLALDIWIEGLSEALTRRLGHRPRPTDWLTAGEDVRFEREGRIGPRNGVVWAPVASGTARYLDDVERTPKARRCR